MPIKGGKELPSNWLQQIFTVDEASQFFFGKDNRL